MNPARSLPTDAAAERLRPHDAGVARRWACTLVVAALPLHSALAAEAPAADAAADLAKKLQNPIAALISLPFKLNYDTGIGSADADRYTFLVQPVIPFSLNQDWNLISRTIMPFVHAQSPVSGGSDTHGSGDILQSLFFSPKAPTSGGWVWGVGPVFSLPTASRDALGSEQWGAGPTFIVLRQESGWTYGALANHLWGFGGNAARSNVSATFVQPFLSYTTPKFTTYSVNTESSYDWKATRWTVPINLAVSQLMRFGKQPVSFAFGLRAYAERPDGGPDWGLSFTTTLLFPG